MKKVYEMLPGNKYQVFFNFQRIVCKKESREVCMLIWIDLDRLHLNFCKHKLIKSEVLRMLVI